METGSTKEGRGGGGGDKVLFIPLCVCVLAARP